MGCITTPFSLLSAPQLNIAIRVFWHLCNTHYLITNILYIMNVFFKKVLTNPNTGSAVIQCTSEPLTQKLATLGGMPVATSTRKNIVWGNLSLNDPETGLVMRANHPTMQHYMQTLEPGQELEGFRMSENPCMDMKTGEATNIMWVEAY